MKDKIIVGIVLLFAIIGLGETIALGANLTKPHKNKAIIVRDSIITSRNAQLEDCIKELDAYRQYYINTETMLDSLGVDADSPYLETDYGSNYLDSKAKIDSIYNQNHPKPQYKKL